MAAMPALSVWPALSLQLYLAGAGGALGNSLAPAIAQGYSRPANWAAAQKSSLPT
jgi:hypothetical protein